MIRLHGLDKIDDLIQRLSSAVEREIRNSCVFFGKKGRDDTFRSRQSLDTRFLISLN